VRRREMVCPHCSKRLVIAERYVLVDFLGSGGFAKVYKALDSSSGGAVAVKIVPMVASDPALASRLRNEVRNAQRVDSPRVCRVYGGDFFDADSFYIAMEFIDGVCLHELKGALAPLDAFGVVIALVEGLEAIHGSGVVHRDVKLKNVMCDKEGKVHIIDFGIAKRPDQTTVTGASQVMGTPYYMPLEQLERKSDPDRRADIYAAGVLICELFTGRVPFRSDNLFGLVQELRAGTPDVARLPPPLQPVILKALAKRPEDRQQTATVLLADLRAACETYRRGCAPAPVAPRQWTVVSQPKGEDSLNVALRHALVAEAAWDAEGAVEPHHLFGTLTRRWILGDLFYGQVGLRYVTPLTLIRAALGLKPGPPPSALAISARLSGESEALLRLALSFSERGTLTELNLLAALHQRPDARVVQALALTGRRDFGELLRHAQDWCEKNRPEPPAVIRPDGVIQADRFLADLPWGDNPPAHGLVTPWDLFESLLHQEQQVLQWWRTEFPRTPVPRLGCWAVGMPLHWTDVSNEAREVLIDTIDRMRSLGEQRVRETHLIGALVPVLTWERLPPPASQWLQMHGSADKAWNKALHKLGLDIL
jgi:predicted Ser/Thr protein kinase